MTIEERCKKLKSLISCFKCQCSGHECIDDCPTQYEAGNMGEIIENLDSILKILEQNELIKAYWIKHELNGRDYLECPKCSCWYLMDHLLRRSYCPNCGKKMSNYIKELKDESIEDEKNRLP